MQNTSKNGAHIQHPHCLQDRGQGLLLVNRDLFAHQKPSNAFPSMRAVSPKLHCQTINSVLHPICCYPKLWGGHTNTSSERRKHSNRDSILYRTPYNHCLSSGAVISLRAKEAKQTPVSLLLHNMLHNYMSPTQNVGKGIYLIPTPSTVLCMCTMM